MVANPPIASSAALPQHGLDRRESAAGQRDAPSIRTASRSHADSITSLIAKRAPLFD
jgi:hypothetical protein